MSEIGRGATAVVYLARDDRHARDVAIKMLRPEVALGLSWERFEREIAIVARLQHPHILPLHDSGVVDGLPYYVMPYVEGQSLRELMRRDGPLPIDDAVAIARDVADALDYAHRRGLVHRDIKPENILLSSGRAIVADFGLGRAVDAAASTALTDTGGVVGTPAYMSPEQLGGSAERSAHEVDGRTDVYSLGCVLFEMLTGRPPFPGPGLQDVYRGHLLQPPPDVAELRPDVPPALRQAVGRALAKAPGDRYATAGELLSALGGARTPPPQPASWLRSGGSVAAGLWPRARRRRRRILAGLATAAAALALLAVVVPRSPRVPFAARDWVLLADFENSTGDSALDRSLVAALSIALQQSRHVNVVPSSRVRELMPRLVRSPSDPVTEAVARDLAQRTGSQAVVAGSVARLADAYLLTARVVDPATGEPLASVTARASDRGQIMEAVDDLSRQLRRALGESRAELRARSASLPLYTTRSIDALRHYVDGARAFTRTRYDEARVHYDAALAADSDFVLAHSGLGRLSYALGDRPRGERHFAKALSLVGRLTERERLNVTAGIAEARGEFWNAAVAREQYLREYPDDGYAWGALGYANLRLERCPAAIRAYERAIAIDSVQGATLGMGNAYSNLATCRAMLRQHEPAVAAMRRAIALVPSIALNANAADTYANALYELGRVAEANAVFKPMLDSGGALAARAHRSLGTLAASRGRYDSAEVHYREALRFFYGMRNNSNSLGAYRTHLFLAAVADRRGDGAQARRELDAAYGIFRSSYIDPPFSALLGRALARRGDLRRAREVLDSVARRANPEARTDRALLHVLRGEVALAEGRRREAVEQMAIAYTADSMTHVLASLAHALAAAGDLDGAAARYRALIARADQRREGLDYWAQAHLELGRIHEAKGDGAEAARWYAALLDAWQGAESDLPPLRELRGRLTRLRGPGGGAADRGAA